VAEGLQRATLAALLTRGPWTVTADGYDTIITPERLEALYESIRRDRPDFRGLGGVRSARPADRALQLLRKAGLIEFAGTPKRWRVREVRDDG
jgi:hypothetical protein